MEAINCRVKCKRQKTRKCLDKLRKRSRHCTNIINQVASRLQSPKKTKISELSLSTFTNVIRSKPITRRNIQSESNNQQNLNNLIVTCTKNSALNQKCRTRVTQETELDTGITDRSICNALIKDFKQCNYREKIRLKTGKDKSPESYNILFSPVEVDIKEQMVSGDTTSPQTNITRDTIAEDRHHLYEKIMEEIPIYLRTNVPSLFKVDVMANTQSHMRKLYTRSIKKFDCDIFQDKREENNSNNKYSDMSHKLENTLIENPLEYITYGNAWQKNVHDKLEITASATTKISKSPCMSFTTASCQPSRMLSPIHITPDHNFFPHKLK